MACLAVIVGQSAVAAWIADLKQFASTVEVLNVEAMAFWWSIEQSMNTNCCQAVQVVLRQARHYNGLEVTMLIMVELILFATWQNYVGWLW